MVASFFCRFSCGPLLKIVVLWSRPLKHKEVDFGVDNKWHNLRVELHRVVFLQDLSGESSCKG